MRGRTTRARLSAGLVVAAVALTPAAASAGNPIEDRLKEGLAVELVKKIADAKVRTVGVLKFRVQKGNEPATFSAGPMNAVLATVVENALLMQNTDLDGGAPPLELIRDAGRTAAGLKEKVTYLTPEGLSRLFDLEYDLAWGGTKAKADGFVTGLVRLAPDRKTTTVVIELIDRKTRKPAELARFEVPTTRGVLNDLCESFGVGRAKIQAAGPDDLDREATLLSLGVAELEEPPTATGKPPAAEKTAAEKPVDPIRATGPVSTVSHVDRPLSLEILYADRPQKVVARRAASGDVTFHVPEPQAGQAVTFRIKNLWNERIAVALAVNGRNTLHMEDVTQVPAGRLTKWVLEAGEEVLVKGFYPKDGKECELIEGLSAESSAREELDPHPKLGAIQVFAFAQGRSGDEADDAEEGLRRIIDTAGLKTAKEAAEAVARSAGRRIAPAGLIARSGEVVPVELRRVTFANPVEVYSQVVWYYERKGK